MSINLRLYRFAGCKQSNKWTIRRHEIINFMDGTYFLAVFIYFSFEGGETFTFEIWFCSQNLDSKDSFGSILYWASWGPIDLLFDANPTITHKIDLICARLSNSFSDLANWKLCRGSGHFWCAFNNKTQRKEWAASTANKRKQRK